MNLLVSCIPYDNGKSGISVYERELVQELVRQGHNATLILEPGVTSESLGVSCPYKNAPRWTRPAIVSMLWHLMILPFWILFHRKQFQGFLICAANRRVCAFYPLPTAATVHDLANFRIKGKYSRLRMFYLAHVLPFFAKRAQHLIAVSRATKEDMLTYWHCKDEHVTVLLNGCNPRRTCTATGRALRTKATGTSGTSGISGMNGTAREDGDGLATHRGSAIVYVSRIEHPGKNHVRLIEAYGRLEPELAKEHPLLLAGSDWKDAEVVHEVAEKSPNAASIRFLGFVEDVGKLWEETGFYVFPSLFEGFGLSLLEAMAAGIPCACSNNGALGEIAGDAAITFPPEDVDAIEASLRQLLCEPEDERQARIARGKAHVGNFSWEKHAQGVITLLEKKPGDEKSVRMFGIPVAKVTSSQALETIVAMAKEQPDRTRFVATLNVDFVSNAVSCWPFKGNDELWGYLKKADLVTADGMPIVLLSKLRRKSLPERVTGADLVPAIFRRFSEEGLSIYILGASQEALDEALPKLPKVNIVGTDTGIVKLDEEQPEIVERINAAKPNLLFVALGNPKQELWMGRNADKLHVPVMIGVGGTFNFVSGKVKRAPRWMQKCGMEWIYRIIQEPGRLWRRYAYGLFKFSWLSLRILIRGDFK